MAHEIIHDEDAPVTIVTKADRGLVIQLLTDTTVGGIIEIAGEKIEVLARVHPEGRLSLTITQLDPDDTLPGPAKQALLRSGLIEETPDANR